MNDPYSTPRRPLDPAAIAEFNAGVQYARLAYEARTKRHRIDDATDARIDYEARIAASEKQKRYRARKKKEQGK